MRKTAVKRSAQEVPHPCLGEACAHRRYARAEQARDCEIAPKITVSREGEIVDSRGRVFLEALSD